MTLAPFAPAHLAILAAVPLAAWGLATVARRRPETARALRLALAAAIAVDALAWYAYTVRRGWFDPPAGLPLDLCDVLPWLAVAALVTGRRWTLEASYFLGVAGSGMALVTPDLGAGVPPVAAAQFFVAHGLVVAAALFLPWSGAFRPRPGAWWRVFLAVNAYALAVGLFNLRFGTNYMYLREKPAAGSLLDLLGPWPWYVLAGEAVALALLWLLGLPFRRNRRAPAAAAPGGR